MFSVHTAPVIFEHATINGHFEFLLEENHMIIVFISPQYLMEGNRPLSKEQTKIPRFILEGPRQCAICFAFIHYRGRSRGGGAGVRTPTPYIRARV